VLRFRLQQALHHVAQILGKLLRNHRVVALQHLPEQSVHVVRLEGRLETDHFVENASERPQVRLVVVGLVAPDLGTCVVRSARLGVVQTLLIGHLRNVQVAQLGCAVLVEENIC